MAGDSSPRADSDEIKRTLRLFCHSGVYELRALKCAPTRGKGKPMTAAGCFDDIAEMAAEAVRIDREHTPGGIYFPFNPLRPEMMARANPNMATAYAEITASDADVAAREWLLVDFDPRRARGISATNAEVKHARDVADATMDWLSARGWPAPVEALSGNGVHLLYRIALPNDAEATAIVKGVLAALAARFDNDAVMVDPGNFNAARITKLYGTVARKGAHTPDRPHRVSRLVTAPDNIVVVTREQLVAVADLATGTKATASPRGRASLGSTNGVLYYAFKARGDVIGVCPAGGWTVRCPRDDKHSTGEAGDSSTVLFPPGAGQDLRAFKCQHGGCIDLDTRAVLATFTPKELVDARAAVSTPRATFEPPPMPDVPPPTDDDDAPSASPRDPGTHCTDLGNAQLLVRMMAGNHRHSDALLGDGWLHYDGVKWSPDDTGEVVRRAKGIANEWRAMAPAYNGDLVLPPEEQRAQNRRKLVLKHAMKCESAASINAMVALAKTEPEVVVRPRDLDVDRFLFNTPAGTIELETGTLRPHDKRDLLTKVSGCGLPLHERGACPRWLAFLDKIFDGDAELIRLVKQLFGYSLSGDVSEELMIFLHGRGRNGKSTLVGVLRYIVGEYARSTAVETFTKDRQHGGIPNDLAALVGARVVTAAEVSEGAPLNEALVKSCTGAEPIPARFLNREWFEYMPMFKVWISTNKMPDIHGADEGIWRRVCLIPFKVTIDPADVDTELGAKLREEGPAIVAWSLDGFADWQLNGLMVPAAVKKAQADYRNEMDQLGAFLDDCCDVGVEKGPTLHADLYRAFGEWCKGNGSRAGTGKAFGKRLEEREIYRSARNGAGRARDGIALRTKREATPGAGQERPPSAPAEGRFAPHPADADA